MPPSSWNLGIKLSASSIKPQHICPINLCPEFCFLELTSMPLGNIQILKMQENQNNCASASIDQRNDSKCIGYKIMHQFCLLFIFPPQTEKPKCLQGTRTLHSVHLNCNEFQCWVPAALPSSSETASAKDHARARAPGQPVKSQWQRGCGHWFALQIY